MSALNSCASVSAAKDFVKFLNKACTPFHAVQTVAEMLATEGFISLPEDKKWSELVCGGRYYVTRNDSSIVAFTVGGQFKPENGVKIVGAHTDSPNFALKPRTASKSDPYNRVAVQCYGGGLWHTWFDRDLTVAGRVIIRREKLETKLVHIKKPLMRIPTLAIHLCSTAEREAFSPNKERHLVPVISTEIAERLSGSVADDTKSSHCIPLMNMLAEAAQCKPEEIIDFDLSVIDTQDATIGGAFDEFIYSPRLDNLVSCFCGIKALINSGNLETDTMVRMVCLFDHEEVGSSSPQGAAGTLVPDIIEHLCYQKCLRATLVANSFLLSVDGAHAVHPNYKDKHEDNHRPTLHNGPVIKYNANTRYATNGSTGAIVKELAMKAEVPIQEFVVKNDSPCGSTIGPILSALSGIKTADIGNAMLSMHSVREMCGTVDICYLTRLIESFFVNYTN